MMRFRLFILVCFATAGMLSVACRDRNRADDDVPASYWQQDDSAHGIQGDVNDDGTVIHDRTTRDSNNREPD